MENELLELLNTLKEEVNKHPRGELILPFRKSIYKLMGEHQDNEDGHAILTIGLLKRTNLAVQCVQKVMPIWDSVMANDTKPHVILEDINNYLAGKQTWDYLWDIPNHFWTVLDNYLLKDGSIGHAVCVGFASINALYVALNDEDLGEEGEEDLLDQDLDPYTWDTAYFASLAYSENEMYDEETKIQKRREFWVWYIDKAVPLAYQATKD